MFAHDPPSVVICRRGEIPSACDPHRTIIWVRGEHDIASRVDLSVAIARAARLDDADIVVDLSGVTFMDASTSGVLVMAHNSLQSRSRSMSVRDPSPQARRLLDLCGLEQLIDDQPTPARQPAPPPPAAAALGTWVEVPASQPEHDIHPGHDILPDNHPDPAMERDRNAALRVAVPTGWWGQDHRAAW